ncbi:hypothetical protein BD626DRAFT_564875 [Schizophyllum amplum]|uniref:Uncharacterized protein n=1 Tax=Schizophyllum amplum TaxID=97359 RepID=A0A550CT88_9AGAR|nr:hypothetical protein BD626DRAFT_564875 [Auriculariopsis ampla]
MSNEERSLVGELCKRSFSLLSEGFEAAFQLEDLSVPQLAERCQEDGVNIDPAAFMGTEADDKALREEAFRSLFKRHAYAEVNGTISQPILGRMGEVLDEISRFVEACHKPFSEADMQGNARGAHFFSIIGYDRSNKTVPAKAEFHRNNEEAVQHLFRSGGAMRQIDQFVTSFVWARFPLIAERITRAAVRLRQAYGDNAPKALDPPETQALTGVFNHRERCWLVIWEAGVIIELPPGVFLAYPSSLFYHWNVDLKDLDKAQIVVTQNGSRPEQANSVPLGGEERAAWDSAAGRGSMVWFNQASMFQSAELGVNTVKEAQKQGLDASCDHLALIEQGYFPAVGTFRIKTGDTGFGFDRGLRFVGKSQKTSRATRTAVRPAGASRAPNAPTAPPIHYQAFAGFYCLYMYM